MKRFRTIRWLPILHFAAVLATFAWILVAVPGCSKNENLIPCPDCQATVSKNAEACPKCGYSFAKAAKAADFSAELDRLEAATDASMAEFRREKELQKEEDAAWIRDLASGGPDFAAKERQKRMDDRNRLRVESQNNGSRRNSPNIDRPSPEQ